MTELSYERHPPSSHSELTSGHDVTHLLSQINQSFKQSKADQILRLLKDQDTLNEKIDDDVKLIQEYDQIKEEKVICDSDTLTDSSSEHETVLDDIADEELEATNATEVAPFRVQRSRTSFGFYGREGNKTDSDNMGSEIDTRDLSIRPKSSYVRRNYRKKDEVSGDFGGVTDEFTEQVRPRPSRSARPPSRHGRASTQRGERRERKIEMVESEVVTPLVQDEIVTVPKEPVKSNVNGGANYFYDRFESTRKPRRESKRSKAFCDSNYTKQNSFENMAVDTGENTMDIKEDIVEIPSTGKQSRNVIQGSITPHANNVVHRNIVQHQTKQQTPIHKLEPSGNTHHHNAVEPGSQCTNLNQNRSETNLSQSVLRQDHMNKNVRSGVRRTDSNNSITRPKNPEPVTSRPFERQDMRPTARRRLQRRYMPQTHNPMSSMRPTSESVILARQKTEKNLLKKQIDNRPHSEKILLNSSNKNMLSVADNPTQGPQTHLLTKDGVHQSSHIQSGDYRKYDPGNRLKTGSRSRDIQGDLTLPRGGPNNVMLGGRKSLALMKLPPLEATLAAKKKGLALAARETCV